mmetsp:Transcript_61050/g.137800  ORF Transcript_61050/g.137800 Transcript_61050/m.137800 type:complete len:834 (-) Transcript_61050:26-2527(-)
MRVDEYASRRESEEESVNVAADEPSTGLRRFIATGAGYACTFTDRYTFNEEDCIGEGAFGRVYLCTDNFLKASRAVKKLQLPEDDSQYRQMRNEINALVELDHPHIVRLVEYFLETDEIFLVMELLEGMSLADFISSRGHLDESTAARCLRHMLKALFCCHSQDIVHNDVRAENFRFSSMDPDAPLKMVDFSLSELFSTDQPRNSVLSDPTFAMKSDIWHSGEVLYLMLSGQLLFDGTSQAHLLEAKTDANFVPSKLHALQTTDDAKDLLAMLLEPSTKRRPMSSEALRHSFITSRYFTANSKRASAADEVDYNEAVQALTYFHEASSLKRLSLILAAHMVTSSQVGIQEMNLLFRSLVRDEWKLDEETMRRRLEEQEIEVPGNFGEIFQTANFFDDGGLTLLEFIAAGLCLEPDIYARHALLASLFHTLSGGGEAITAETLEPLVRLQDGEAMEPRLLIEEATQPGNTEISFEEFCDLMEPPDWEASPQQGARLVQWAKRDADVPPTREASLSQMVAKSGMAVKSMPSIPCAVRQEPGFHKFALQPFYNAQPLSNVVLGIVQGSSYARRSVELDLAQLLPMDSVGGTKHGSFFFMPNPKYHEVPEDLIPAADAMRSGTGTSGKFRFVAWWVHPEFLLSVKTWMTKLSSSAWISLRRKGSHSCSMGSIVSQTQEQDELERPCEVGAPGDFRFSDVPKPLGYLNTYRDLAGDGHVELLEALATSARQFLEHVIGNAMSTARVSTGFHYPVRTQYSTLHLQLRVNSGDVSGGADGRGIDLLRLMDRLKKDPFTFSRDEETLRYQVTSNSRAVVLTAADNAGRKYQEIGPHSVILH